MCRHHTTATTCCHPAQAALTRNVVSLFGLTPGEDYLRNLLARASADPGSEVPAGCVVSGAA